MWDAVRGLRVNPLLMGLGVLLAGVVVTYGDRRVAEEMEDATLFVEMVRPAFVVPPEVQLLADLEYARPNGQPLHLDLYRPEEITGPLPVLLWIHGDGWRSGSKADPVAAVNLVPRGYAVASLDYRLSDVALFPAQIEDCLAAVRWLRSHAEAYQLDPNRIAAWGETAGGHLAALLGAMSHGTTDDNSVSADVQAVIDIGGPIDFLTLDEQAPEDAAVRHADPWSPESFLVGGPIHERQELVALTNPLAYLAMDRRPPPFLVIHSQRDPIVPVRQSELLVRSLRRAGGTAQLIRPEAMYHNGTVSRDVEEVVTEFLDRRLKNAQLPTTVNSSDRRPYPFRHIARRIYRESLGPRPNL